MKSNASRLAGMYLLYFGSIGVLLPFLPAYLETLGLTATQIGALLAIGPTLASCTPPLFGHLADRFGRPDWLLRVIGWGAFSGMSFVLWAEHFWSLFGAMAFYAFFASSMTTLLDSMTVDYVQEHGGSYARLRLFGSTGFVLASTAFGVTVSQIDRTAVWVPWVLIGGYWVWSFSLSAPRVAPRVAVHPLAGLSLLRRREISVFLMAAALHWITSAPYHGMFALHVRALGLPPLVVGLSAALGVTAEIVVMYLYPRIADRVAARQVLFVAFAATAVRWFGLSLVSNAVGVVLLNLLHGLSFGLFYVAAITYLVRRIPSGLRASGQALFASVTFGLGGVVGFLGAGYGYDQLGGHRLFAVVALLELIPALLALTLRPPSSQQGILAPEVRHKA